MLFPPIRSQAITIFSEFAVIFSEKKNFFRKIVINLAGKVILCSFDNGPTYEEVQRKGFWEICRNRFIYDAPNLGPFSFLRTSKQRHSEEDQRARAEAH